jgi:hypothetical protein
VNVGWTPAERLSWARTLVAEEPGSGTDAPGTAGELDRLCRAVTKSVFLSGAVVSLMNEGGPAGIVANSGREWIGVEELAFIVGEGPCWDAFESRRPVMVLNIDSSDETRWPAYCRAAFEGGVRAVFAFPLKVGLARLGVLGLYRDKPGGLDDNDLELVHAFVELITTLLIDGQEQAGVDEVPTGVGEALGSRFEVYQAQGMVMVQLGITLADAMARLRARAYATDRTLGEVARDVVSRSLTFEPEGLDPGSQKGSGP